MWERKKPPQVKVAQNLIKKKSIITESGEVIRNTKEDPDAVERYLRSKRR
jgi:predicted DNA-binding protein (UPF0251 family)